MFLLTPYESQNSNYTQMYIDIYLIIWFDLIPQNTLNIFKYAHESTLFFFLQAKPSDGTRTAYPNESQINQVLLITTLLL